MECLSIYFYLKHNTGFGTFKPHFFHAMMIRSPLLPVPSVMLASFGFICTRLGFNEPMHSNILQDNLLKIDVGLPRICFKMEPTTFGERQCLVGANPLVSMTMACLAIMVCFGAPRLQTPGSSSSVRWWDVKITLKEISLVLLHQKVVDNLWEHAVRHQQRSIRTHPSDHVLCKTQVGPGSWIKMTRDKSLSDKPQVLLW